MSSGTSAGGVSADVEGHGLVTVQAVGPGPELERDNGTLRELWRFREFARPDLPRLLLGVVFRTLELGADLATPWPLALVINDLLGEHKGSEGPLVYVARFFGGSPLAILLVAAVSTLIFAVLSGVFDYLGDLTMNGAGERITARIRGAVFGLVERLPMGYHDRQSVGELSNRVMSDTSKIEDSLVDLFTTLIPAMLALVGTMIVMVWVNWRLGLVGLCSAPLVFVTALHYARLTRVLARRRRAAIGRLTGFTTESLQGIRTVHAFGNQSVEDARFRATNDQVLDLGLRRVDLSARFTPALEIVSALGVAALLFVGGYGAWQNWWTVGVLVVVTAYLNNILKPMKDLAKLAPSFNQGAASAERIAAILDEPREHLGPVDGLPERVSGLIELRDVGLTYGRGPVLGGLNLTVAAGERLALLGDNGAGKSTTLGLIGGLYAPTSGQVLLDGLPVPDLPEHWLHQQVAMVLQDTFLFSGTLADNLRYGRPEATDEQVAAVAEAALVTEFTDRLPDGLATTIAAGGVGLSGGQRQRVGIARALLVDSPVVLLDEPTVGLDAHAETLVVRALARLMENRTVIMTTHQPELTQLATRTVYLRRGGVLDEAPPRSRPPAPATAESVTANGALDDGRRAR